MKLDLNRLAYDVSSAMHSVSFMLRETDFPDFNTIDRLMCLASGSLSKLRRAVRNRRYQCRLTGKMKK